ncbi:MAG: 1-acyl-sn-glycerol-3-phosphate acyltransferase [Bacteroidales bacterium]|nr:1-acyl-sn-glycerol-3-phosphate acyltransferase [Bacteroidales bacterium]
MKRIWIAIVRLCGWKFELPEDGERPELRRCVFAVAPHTSVSDFLVGAAYLWALDVNGHIFIKKEFFRWPLGGLLRRLGAIPIDRGNRKGDMVGQAVREFARGGTFSLAITPEGTRKPTRRWKRGFWEIASQAGVPIVPACIDFGHKRIWLERAIVPTGDFEADLREVRRGFKAQMARHPKQFVELDNEQ